MSALQMVARVMGPVSGFARVTFYLRTLFEVLIDARQDAAAARERYPFAEW